MIGLWQFLLEDEEVFRYPDIFGLRLPETSMYLNLDGISYKFRSGYQINSTIFIPLSVETIIKGTPRLEYSLGLHYQFNPEWTYHGEFRLGAELGYTHSISMKLNKELNLQIGISQEDFRNLYGERNISSLEYGNIHQELWLATQWQYQ